MHATPTHASDDFLLPIVGVAIRLLLPLLAIILGSSMLPVPDRLQALFRNGVSMLLVGAFAYVLYRLVDAACDLILERHRIDVPDNREARAIYTQVTVLRKVAVSTIVLFAFAAMLMVFDEVRQIGATILASAGVAGIVIGFAAQRSLSMLLAGFQIALTQPIRIDDVVVVEGEWGKVEEITLTYVVINIWDMRRLIVPISYFIEKPFQNWTRTTVALLCTVELYVDYDFPMEALRAKLTAILNASKLWDHKVNVLQVTDAKEHTVQLRALMSAADSGAAWDLRCEVREGLLRFLQQGYPASLPRFRVARTTGQPPAAEGSEPRAIDRRVTRTHADSSCLQNPFPGAAMAIRLPTSFLIGAACLALAAPHALPAADASPAARITLEYDQPLPNVPGKSLRVVRVEYPPGGSSPAHLHAPSAFIFARVLKGAIRSAVNDGPPRVYKAGEAFQETAWRPAQPQRECQPHRTCHAARDLHRGYRRYATHHAAGAAVSAALAAPAPRIDNAHRWPRRACRHCWRWRRACWPVASTTHCWNW